MFNVTKGNKISNVYLFMLIFVFLMFQNDECSDNH